MRMTCWMKLLTIVLDKVVRFHANRPISGSCTECNHWLTLVLRAPMNPPIRLPNFEVFDYEIPLQSRFHVD